MLNSLQLVTSITKLARGTSRRDLADEFYGKLVRLFVHLGSQLLKARVRQKN